MYGNLHLACYGLRYDKFPIENGMMNISNFFSKDLQCIFLSQSKLNQQQFFAVFKDTLKAFDDS